MKRFATFVLGTLLSLGLLPQPAAAAGVPLIVSTTVDYTNKTLTINGHNFGSNPVVTLNGLTFPTGNPGPVQIVATFPDGHPPSSFTPGTYFLTVRYRKERGRHAPMVIPPRPHRVGTTWTAAMESWSTRARG